MKHTILLGSILLAAMTARADILVTRSLTHTGQVIRVDAGGVTIKVAAGDFTIPFTEIVSLDVPQPPALATAANAVRAKNYPDAIKTLKPYVDNLAGLQADWMQDAMLLLGDAYASIPEAANARKVYDQFKQLYKNSPKANLVDGKFAKILVGQGKYAEALPLLETFLKPLLSKQSVIDAEEQAAAESLLLLGDCQRNTGKLDGALDSYLTIVTLFDVDTFVTLQARQHVGEIFEQQKRWPRAKQAYQELLDHGAPPNITEDAQKKLAALKEAHPE